MELVVNRLYAVQMTGDSGSKRLHHVHLQWLRLPLEIMEVSRVNKVREIYYHHLQIVDQIHLWTRSTMAMIQLSTNLSGWYFWNMLIVSATNNFNIIIWNQITLWLEILF